VGDLVSGFTGDVRLQEITSYGDGRIEPSVITLTNGSWAGSVTMYRADETSINRGNVNILASLDANPLINGTSDPFSVHPGVFSRVQIVVPGEDPLPGSATGLTGSPASQAVGQTFTVDVYATDDYWNPLPSGDLVRITSSDAGASTPVTGMLNSGFRQFTLSLGTVGTQTLTVTDQTNGSIQGMTSSGILVTPSAPDHFEMKYRPRKHRPRSRHLHQRRVVGGHDLQRRRRRGVVQLLRFFFAAAHRNQQQFRSTAGPLRRTAGLVAGTVAPRRHGRRRRRIARRPERRFDF
jgi:hypothetical protein